MASSTAPANPLLGITEDKEANAEADEHYLSSHLKI